MPALYLASSKGLFHATLNEHSGAWESFSSVSTHSTRWLVLDPHRPLLYATAHDRESEGRKTGIVQSFRISPTTLAAEKISEQATEGVSACYANVTPDGQYLVAANFTNQTPLGQGLIMRFPIDEAGKLQPADWQARHLGSGEQRPRQEHSHPHSAVIDPSGRFFAVGDLGIDRVMLYAISDPNWLRLGEGVQMPPASGPRHAVWSPDSRHLYVNNEMKATVAFLEFDPATGQAILRQIIEALPAGWDGSRAAADLHLHPSGRFLYSSNRGHNSIATFERDLDTGQLKFLGTTPSEGEIPRGFGVSPDGEWMVVANQKSDNIALFRIDSASGLPAFTGKTEKIASCECIRFVN